MSLHAPADENSAAVSRVATNLPAIADARLAHRASRAARARTTIVLCTVLLDAALIWLAFSGAYYLRYHVRWVPIERDSFFFSPFRDWIPFGLGFTILQIASLLGAGAYRTRLGKDLLDESLLLLRATLGGVGLLAIIAAFLPLITASRLVIVYAWLLLWPLLLLGHSLLYAALGRLHGSGWNTRRVLVAGTSPISRMLLQNLLGRRQHGYDLVGFVAENKVPVRADFGRFKCLGRVDDLEDVVAAHAVDEVIVALPATHHEEIAAICSHCERAGVRVQLVPDLFELSLARVHMDHLAGIPLMTVRQPTGSRVALAIKRGMDLAISCALLLIVSPIMAVTALAIKLDSPGPILYRSARVGKGGKEFTFYKFRSMKIDADGQWEALAVAQGNVKIFKDRKDPRRTRVGNLIRPLSIDELPQLFNILRGDMSLVGPRPPLPFEVADYEERHWKRLSVIGGLTGMWQVSGRSEIKDFEEVLIMDTYYIDNWSLALDLKILLRTVLAVVRRTGAY